MSYIHFFLRFHPKKRKTLAISQKSVIITDIKYKEEHP